MKFFCGNFATVKDISECKKEVGEKCGTNDRKCETKPTTSDSDSGEPETFNTEQSFI